MPLEIYLLGPPRFELEGERLYLSRRKSIALLAYLAATGQPQTRDALAALLWPEFDESAARTNLRRDLSWLRRLLPEEVLIVDRLQVDLNLAADVWLDVQQFEAAVTAVAQHIHPTNELCDRCAQGLAAAVKLYQADFMAGFSLADNAEFEEWHFFQREQYRQKLAEILQQLIGWCHDQQQFEQGIEYGRRWLALDSWHEPAHRILMRLYALTGQYATAIRQYHICAQTLQTELGIEPEAETKALLAAIQSKQIAPPPFPEPADEGKEEEKHVPEYRHNLPTLPDSFVGRQQEIKEIHHHLTQIECRLLTLRGIGGVGKTRLAIQAAAELIESDSFPDGIFFVNLAGIESPDYLIATIVEALHLTLSHAADPLDQLITYLRNKEILLCLDNFEHLQGGAFQLATLLQYCSRLKLLITSRHQLKLAGEFVLVLGGLPLPQNRQKSSTAVRLFQERARQAAPQLDLKAEKPFIHAICHLVGGMPLAIEMCAAWAQTLNCQEILTQIQQGLDLLEDQRADSPARHLSIRAVFQTSFDLLTPTEQKVLLTLAIFRGGFSHAAARQVAGAKLVHLRALLEKSLLTVYGELTQMRYQMHPLLRQFALEKIEADQLAEGERQHALYFADLLWQLAKKQCTPENLEIVSTVFIEVDNLRKIWSWLGRQIKTNQRPELVCHLLQQILPVWSYAYLYKTYYLEGKHLINSVWQPMVEAKWETVGALQQQTTFAMVTAILGRFCLELSQFEEASRLSQQPLSILQEQADTEYISYALHTWGRAKLRLGDLSGAEKKLIESTATAVTDIAKARAMQALGTLFSNQGKYDAALTYLTEAVSLFEKCYDQAGLLAINIALGSVYGRQRQFEAALPYFKQVVRLARQLEQKGMLMMALNNLAICLNKIGSTIQVEAYFEEALALATEMGNQRWQAMIAQDFGLVLLEQGELLKAEQHMKEGLQLAIALNSQPDVLAGLLPIAHWQAQTGHFEEALVALGFMMANKMATEEARTYAADFWEELSSELPAIFTQRAQAKLKAASLDDILAMMSL